MSPIKLISAVAIVSSITACSTSGTWSCEIGSVGGGKPSGSCRIEGVWYREAMNFLRPTVNMLAETSGYSFTDWSNSDFGDFSLRVNDSTVKIRNENVVVKVFSGASIIGTKTFKVKRSGNVYRLANSDTAKNWALNFLNSADYVEVDYSIEKSAPGLVTISAQEKGTTKASASIHYKGGGSMCRGSVCYKER